MRTLILRVARRSGALPTLLAVALAPACGGSVESTQSTSQGGGGSTTTSQGGGGTTSSTAGGGTGGIGGIGGTGGTGGPQDPCDGLPIGTYTVEVPEEGVPAEPGQICASVVMPVVSNFAARVTLTKYSAATNLAMGFVEIEPSLQGLVVGLPTIEVSDAQVPDLLPMTVTNVQAVSGGFSFHAEWPPPLDLPPYDWARMTVKTTFDVLCDAATGDTRTVEANTIIHLCVEGSDVGWVSSGDECKVCEVIMEMAPSPIVPDKHRDELPLARAVRLRLVQLARIGRSLVLFAENDGGADMTYDWHASGGAVEAVAPDIVVWTLPEGAGPHLLQAVVSNDDGAAVASHTTGEAA